MKQAAAATLLLALVAAAAAVTPSVAAMAEYGDGSAATVSTTGGGGGGGLGLGHGHHHRGRTWRDSHGGGNRSPLAGLAECVTVCGTGVSKCMLDCYKPEIGLNPVQLPLCLLQCTNNALVCGSSCSTDII